MPRKGTPRPNNGGARVGTGPLRSVQKWQPFSATKGETISIADIRLFRCNHCGAIAWNQYSEDVLIGGNFEHINHAEQLIQHKHGCPLSTTAPHVGGENGK